MQKSKKRLDTKESPGEWLHKLLSDHLRHPVFGVMAAAKMAGYSREDIHAARVSMRVESWFEDGEQFWRW